MRTHRKVPVPCIWLIYHFYYNLRIILGKFVKFYIFILDNINDLWYRKKHSQNILPVDKINFNFIDHITYEGTGVYRIYNILHNIKQWDMENQRR